MSDSTRPFEDLLVYTKPHLRGCPKELILQAATEVARDFCHDTHCWQYNLSPIYVRSGKLNYELSLDGVICDAEIVGIVDAYLDGVKLSQQRGDYSLSDRTIFQFSRDPGRNISKGLLVVVALRPVEGADEIDARVFNDYYTAFADGIIWKRCEDEEKPWSNPARATQRRIDYEGKKGVARVDVNRGGPGMTKSMQMRPRHKFV